MHVNLLQHCVQAIDMSINLAITLQWTFTDTSTPKRAKQSSNYFGRMVSVFFDDGKKYVNWSHHRQRSEEWRMDHSLWRWLQGQMWWSCSRWWLHTYKWLAVSEHAVHSLNCQWTIHSYFQTHISTVIIILCFATLMAGTASTKMHAEWSSPATN